jgi:Bacterial mobilisation protein (MobC)
MWLRRLVPSACAIRDMGKPAGSFTVALGVELKARLVAAAHAAGTTPAVLTRRAIGKALGDDRSEDRVTAPVNRPDEPLKEIRLKVPEGAAVRLAQAARAAGVTRSAFVSASAIGLAERSEARFMTEEQAAGIEAVGTLREALVKSNATLAPIGRNLNQVARVLNTQRGLVSKSDRENLAEIAQRVSAHLELASELLHAIRAPRIRTVR